MTKWRCVVRDCKRMVSLKSDRRRGPLPPVPICKNHCIGIAGMAWWGGVKAGDSFGYSEILDAWIDRERMDTYLAAYFGSDVATAKRIVGSLLPAELTREHT